MHKTYIPALYKPTLDAYDTQRAIAYIKQTFQDEFSSALNLKRVSAPLFVTENSGLNDNLNGYERPVSFDVPAVGADALSARYSRTAISPTEYSTTDVSERTENRASCISKRHSPCQTLILMTKIISADTVITQLFSVSVNIFHPLS